MQVFSYLYILNLPPYIWCFWSIKFLSYYYLIFLFIIQIASEREGCMDKNEPLTVTEVVVVEERNIQDDEQVENNF